MDQVSWAPMPLHSPRNPTHHRALCTMWYCYVICTVHRHNDICFWVPMLCFLVIVSNISAFTFIFILVGHFLTLKTACDELGNAMDVVLLQGSRAPSPAAGSSTEVAGFQPQRHPTVLPKSSGTACWRRFGQGQEEPQESQGWLLVQVRSQAMVPSHGCTRGPQASTVSVWPHNWQGFNNWFCAFCDHTTHFIACSNINTFEISTSDKQ